MGSLISLFGSSAFGALFGSLFSWLNKREERAELAEKNAHEEKMQGIANTQALALASKAIEGTVVAGEQVVAAKEADAFVASQQSAFQATTSHAVEIARGLMRPLITCYVLGVATYFAYNISALVGGLKTLDPAATFALYGNIIDEIFFLANLCVSWWFGARGSSKRVTQVAANQS